jgi:hypothetical protein
MKIIVAVDTAQVAEPGDFCYTEVGELLGPCSVAGAFTGTKTRKCATFGVVAERDRDEVTAQLIADAKRMTHVTDESAVEYAAETLDLWDIMQDAPVGAEVRTHEKNGYEVLTFSKAA